MEIEIHHTTARDIIAFYGKPSDRTVRAFSVYIDGEIGAIAGISITPSIITFFSDTKHEIKVPKLTIWRVSKEIVRRIREFNLPVYSVQSCEIPSAGKFLEALGFKYVGEFSGNKQYRL